MRGTSGDYVIKLFPAIINSVAWKASEFETGTHFHPSLIFVFKAGAYPSGAPRG